MAKGTIIMAIYPNSKGLGYVISEETPNNILSYGVGSIRIATAKNYAIRIRKMIKRYTPTVVILKDYCDAGVVVSKRVRQIIKSMEQEANNKDIKVYRYSRKKIRAVFQPYTDNPNKYGISLVLSLWYPYLKRFIAPPRTHITSESYRMVMFDAFALLYCYFTFNHHSHKNQHENTNTE